LKPLLNCRDRIETPVEFQVHKLPVETPPELPRGTPRQVAVDAAEARRAAVAEGAAALMGSLSEGLHASDARSLLLPVLQARSPAPLG
jgi:hypothetical protein